MRKQRRRRPTGERKRVKKLPKREQRNLLRGIDEKQEKEGRGEDKEEAPKGEGKQRKEGVALEGEEKGKKRGRGGKRRRRRKRYGGGVEGVGGGYKRYVFRVVKQVHPGMAVSSRAMAVLDGMMTDMIERLADEAARLSRYAGKATLSSREIQDAVLLLGSSASMPSLRGRKLAVSSSADHGT